MQTIDKAALRRRLRACRLQCVTREQESRDLCAHLLASPEYQAARCVLCYMALPHEADVSPIAADVLASGRTLVLPRIDEDGQMTLRRAASSDALAPGVFGILEPQAAAAVVRPEEIDLMIVPLEAIDREGWRLGKGGGYYDRLLPKRHCPAIGAVLQWQWIDAVPRDEWDQPLDGAAEQTGVRRFSTKPARKGQKTDANREKEGT